MKKTRIILSVLVAMSILTVIAFSGCEEPEPNYTVKYEITGPSVTGTVLYYNATGGLDTVTNVSIPWTKTITVTGKNKPVGCGFTIVGSSNTYTCILYINGKEEKRASSNSNATAVSITK